MAGGRHLENRYDVIFLRRMFRFGRNSTADYGEMVEIETGNRTWRTFVF